MNIPGFADLGTEVLRTVGEANSTRGTRWMTYVSEGVRLMKRYEKGYEMSKEQFDEEDLRKRRDAFKEQSMYIPENWMEPGYKPESKTMTFSSIIIILACLMVMVFSLRLYARLRVERKFGWDDRFAVLASLFYIPGAIVSIVNFRVWALGFRTIDSALIAPGAEKYCAMLGFTSTILCLLAQFCIKLSVLFHFNRSLVPEKVMSRRFVQGLAAFICAFQLSQQFLFAFQCGAPPNFWTRTLYATYGENCLPRTTILYISPILSGFLNSVVWAIAAVSIARVEMKLRSRICAACIMSLGLIGATASLVGPVFVDKNAWVDDPAWVAADFTLMINVEDSLCIITTSLFPLKVLFPQWFPEEDAQDVSPKLNNFTIYSLKSGDSFKSNDSRSSSEMTEKFRNLATLTELDPFQIMMPKDKYSGGKSHSAVITAEPGNLSPGVKEGQVMVTREFSHVITEYVPGMDETVSKPEVSKKNRPRLFGF